MPRLFISHANRDKIEALAFQRWLVANGWSPDDVFIDIHGINAGERWRDRLRKANATCEAVMLLASPNSLGSVECEKELELAEALGKPIIPAILRDIDIKDPRLARWSDRQIVDLTSLPLERIEPFEHEGRLHRIEFSIAALASIRARLAHLGVSPDSFAWQPRSRSAGPYPGLAAFGESDAAIFFGREADIMTGLTKLRLLRKRRSPRVLVIQGASGAGKSSFLRAGLWPRIDRDPDFAPLAILRPARGIVSGPNGIASRLPPWFERRGLIKVPGVIEGGLSQPDRKAAVKAFADLLMEATEVATAVRRAGIADARPPAVVLAVDQGEELFSEENQRESQLFLDLLAGVLADLPEDVDPYLLLTISVGRLDPLLQRWPVVGISTPELQALSPLSSTTYRDVITKPAEVFTRNVRRLVAEPALADRLAHDATGGDALPLLAFTLEQLFEKFGADGNLTLARYEAMGGIGGSIDRALADAQRQAGVAGTAENLRHLIVPSLATWDPKIGAAKRLVAREAELTAGAQSILSPLIDALVANRLLTRGAGTLEVAHDTLLRREPIAGWLEQQKDELKLRDDVLREADDWRAAQGSEQLLIRRGERLEHGLRLQSRNDFKLALSPAASYLAACHKAEISAASREQTKNIFIGMLVTCVFGAIALGLAGVMELNYLRVQARLLVDTHYTWMHTKFTGMSVNPKKVDNYKPGTTFRECFSCPEMVVLPVGEFFMGSEAVKNEMPGHKVTIQAPLAVGRYEVTFDEWDACVALGGCSAHSGAGGSLFGRGRQPVIHVNWKDTQDYTKWLAKQTGGAYRLLTEAEWEYSVRAATKAIGRHPDYHFGDDVKKLCDYANGADLTAKSKNSDWTVADCTDGFIGTAPVGSFKPNDFDLHDMHGNVWEWVHDCYVDNYQGTPVDGTAAKEVEGCSRVLRGGGWSDDPRVLRAAKRVVDHPDVRNAYLGFRVARTLSSGP